MKFKVYIQSWDHFFLFLHSCEAILREHETNKNNYVVFKRYFSCSFAYGEMVVICYNCSFDIHLKMGMNYGDKFDISVSNIFRAFKSCFLKYETW